MIHAVRPDLVDMAKVQNNSAKVNLESAFTLAEVHFGIARLLDPEGLSISHH